MADRRLLVIGLDGFEISLADAMMAQGELPNMAYLAETAAVFDLDHGEAKATGLAWEHVSTGRAPENGGRWSAITFDPETYAARQEPTRAAPVFADLDGRLVVFDVPYFDLGRSHARGITCWGAHDPGVDPQSQPPGLHSELDARFGGYVADRWVYGFTWPSQERTAEACKALMAAVRQRTEAATWLLAERLPDWDCALMTVSEAHSAIEQFWHGVDREHPLNDVPSAAQAGEAVRGVYREIDRMIGELRRTFSNAGIIVFSMHGMGRNDADVPAMALLPELMFRFAFGRALASTPHWPLLTPRGLPMLQPDEDWSTAVHMLLPPFPDDRAPSSLDWMPTMRYQPYWRDMPAFAFPAFYDGQIRLNVAGRERYGIITLDRYEIERNRLVALLQETRCLVTGEPVVGKVWFPQAAPLERAPSEPDLYIQWRGTPIGFDHPVAGSIGPYPHRRTGGHTGERGIAWIDWPGVPRQRRWCSAFDVVPTIFELLGEAAPSDISGISMVQREETGSEEGSARVG